MLILPLLALSAHADELVRVATWNIQTVGSPGTAEYDAALDVLTRIGADVVAIQEVENAADAGNLASLAADAGYAYSSVADSGPMGALRTAVLSMHPIVAATSVSAAELSGDPAANDITRYFLQMTVDVTGSGDELTLITSHWKSGWGDDNELRRSVESIRAAQAVARFDGATDAVVLVGDMNEEIDNGSLSPTVFTSLTTGLPSTWRAGSDITAMLAAGGLDNDPFGPIEVEAVVVDALQVDGTDGTRPASGRRLDYMWVSQALNDGGVDAEVFDCADEALGGGLEKYGSPLASGMCASASDHLPVFADLLVPTTPTLTTHGAGALTITEVMANPLDESTGEYVEIYNAGPSTVDLAGYVLDDGDITDTLRAYGTGDTLLAPGAYAVVVDPGFAGDYTVPAGTLLLTADGSAICNGLAVNDPITLYESDSTTLVGAWTAPFNPGDGVSAERAATGWEAHACSGATHSFGEAYCR